MIHLKLVWRHNDDYEQSRIKLTSPENMLYKISNISDAEATLIEPTACAIHGVDRIHAALPKGASGLDVLLLGSGPSGLLLAQLLRLNGSTRVVIAANAGPKTRIAKEIGAADEIIELDRQEPEKQWRKIKEENPYGFDIVVRTYILHIFKSLLTR